MMFKKFKISSSLSSLCDDSDHTVEKVHLGCKDCILKGGKCMSDHLGGGDERILHTLNRIISKWGRAP